MKVLEIYIYSVPFVNKNLLEKEKKKNMIALSVPSNLAPGDADAELDLVGITPHCSGTELIIIEFRYFS